MEQPSRWLRVPVGAEAERWAARSSCRRVLLVVHNVTSATRLLDVLPLFRDDLRLQLVVTWTGTSPFDGGVDELLRGMALPVVPWEQALDLDVDLAISASFGGRLDLIPGKLTVLSHGVGYNKKLGTPVFGLSSAWLLGSDGRPFVDGLVLSHPEQIARLRGACPEAVDSAVLGGDPCFDRILAARPHRDRFRRALGLHPGQRLVVLNSTWNPSALFGDGGEDVLPLLLPRVTDELPADEWRAAAVLHPNLYAGHGPGQVRLWLDRARRSGLALVDPLEGWRQALVAADVVVGDFGAVSYYAAALGTPVLLGAADEAALGPDSPVADFVRTAPRLDPYRALLPQLDQVVAAHVPLPGPAELTTSDPGRSAALLRELFYRLIGIPEPEAPALLDPLPLPPYEAAVRTAPLRVLAGRPADGMLTLRRHAAGTRDPGGPEAAHLAVHEDTLDPGALALADVIVRHGSRDDPRLGPPERWAAETLARFPGCGLAAYVTGPDTCVVRARGAPPVELVCGSGVDPAAAASAYHVLGGGGGPAARFAFRTGTAVHTVRVRPLGSGPLGLDPSPQQLQLLQRLRRLLRFQRARGAPDQL